jgi:hypothetical protein
MTDFDPNWPHGHVTRDGHKARIICTDAGSHVYPIVALVGSCPRSFTSGGRFSASGEHHHFDLLNAPAPKRKMRLEGWVNVYSMKRTSGLYLSKGDADELAGQDRIACIHIDREVEEGEGL